MANHVLMFLRTHLLGVEHVRHTECERFRDGGELLQGEVLIVSTIVGKEYPVLRKVERIA